MMQTAALLWISNSIGGTGEGGGGYCKPVPTCEKSYSCGFIWEEACIFHAYVSFQGKGKPMCGFIYIESAFNGFCLQPFIWTNNTPHKISTLRGAGPIYSKPGAAPRYKPAVKQYVLIKLHLRPIKETSQ